MPSQLKLMCMERRFSQAMASEWQTAFVVSHKMPRCACSLLSRITTKFLKTARLFFKTETKTKTKTFIFVLEAPRDQDPGLEDYITGDDCLLRPRVTVPCSLVFLQSTVFIGQTE